MRPDTQDKSPRRRARRRCAVRVMAERTMPTIEPWPITATVKHFKKLAGLGSTSVDQVSKAAARRPRPTTCSLSGR